MSVLTWRVSTLELTSYSDQDHCPTCRLIGSYFASPSLWVLAPVVLFSAASSLVTELAQRFRCPGCLKVQARKMSHSSHTFTQRDLQLLSPKDMAGTFFQSDKESRVNVNCCLLIGLCHKKQTDNHRVGRMVADIFLLR